MNTILLVLVVAALLYDSYNVRQLRVSVDKNTAETRELRLKSRARVAQAGVQSGPRSQEQEMKRLSRASAGRRIVVGGDDDSEQKQNLMRGVENEDTAPSGGRQSSYVRSRDDD